MRLTGLDVQENQARRLLNDLDEFRAATDRQREDESFVAHDWLTEIFEPAVRSVPRDLRGKLEPAQIYHELLDHRWYLSEQQGRDVPMTQAAKSYVKNILPHASRRAGDPRRAGGRDPGHRHVPAVDPDQVIGSTGRARQRAGGPPRTGRCPRRRRRSSDSTADAIGIDAMASHCSRTSRDRPLPSEPTTSTSGSVAYGRSVIDTSPPPSSPTTNTPAALSPCSVRTRLVTRATGHARRRTRGHLPRRRRHARRTPLRHEHAVGAERPGGPQHGAEVARVGHAVERHDQRRPVGLRGSVEQVVVVRVRVGRHLDGDALVHRPVGEAVQLGAADLEQRVVRVPGGADDLARAVVGLQARRRCTRSRRGCPRGAPRPPSSGRRRSRAVELLRPPLDPAALRLAPAD